MRILVSVGLIVMIMVAAMGAFSLMYAARPQAEPQPIEETEYNVDVFEVSPISFREMLRAFGTARADREVVLAAQVSGEITEVHPRLKIGQPVRAGWVATHDHEPSQRIDPDVLLRIDPRDFQTRVEQAESAIAAAKTESSQLQQRQINVQRQLELAVSDLESMKQEYDRTRSLRDRGGSSPSELTRSALEVRRYEDTIVQLESEQNLLPHQIQAADQRVASAESDLARAENDLARTTVFAPFDGVLGEVMIEQGQFIRAGEPLVRLVDPAKVEVPVSLGLEDFLLIEAAVRAGDFPPAELAENDSAAARWTGRVVRVSPTADAGSRTIEVFIEVDNTRQPQPLLPGTFVFAHIAGPQYSDTLVIPREAILEQTVFAVGPDNRVVEKTIQTGRRLQSMVQVSSGLDSGDRLILTNLDVVRSGTLVVPQSTASVRGEVLSQRASVIRFVDDQDDQP